MTSKERAKLKSIAANEETILQIGKNPLSEAFIKQVRDALKARELIKIRVLETCEMLPAEAAQVISEEVGCEMVQVIGSRVVLFQKRPKSDKKPSLLDENSEKREEKPKKSPAKSKSDYKKVAGNMGYGKKGRENFIPAPKPYEKKQSRIRSVQKTKKGSRQNGK